jgi:hypothetical protein
MICHSIYFIQGDAILILYTLPMILQTNLSDLDAVVYDFLQR